MTKKKLSDVTEDVIDMISSVYQENSPELIYFMTLYTIFNEFLEDISEDVLPNEATGFKNSQIWNKLYNFQKDAVLGIINKLEQYNGCIWLTASVWARPLPPWLSSNITKVEIRMYWFSALKAF